MSKRHSNSSVRRVVWMDSERSAKHGTVDVCGHVHSLLMASNKHTVPVQGSLLLFGGLSGGLRRETHQESLRDFMSLV